MTGSNVLETDASRAGRQITLVMALACSLLKGSGNRGGGILYPICLDAHM